MPSRLLVLALVAGLGELLATSENIDVVSPGVILDDGSETEVLFLTHRHDGMPYDVGNQEEIQTLLRDLFGNWFNLRDVARTWVTRGMHTAADAMSDLPWDKQQAMFPETTLWLRLTRMLHRAKRFNVRFRGPDGSSWGANLRPYKSIGRLTVEQWLSHLSLARPMLRDRPMRCAEMGDGHFLEEHFSALCSERLSLDLHDEGADVRVDWNRPLPRGLGSLLREAFDFIVSVAVLEHLTSPSTAIASANLMLRIGGRLALSLPFLYKDHGSPLDFSRFTTLQVHRLLVCGGFTLRVLRGVGDLLTVLAGHAGLGLQSLLPLRIGARGEDPQRDAGRDLGLLRLRDMWQPRVRRVSLPGSVHSTI